MKKSVDNNLSRLKRVIVPILKKQGVTRAGVFGSYARGEQKKRSDIDILVKLKSGTSLLDVIKLESEIERKTRIKAELVTYKSVHPLLKDRIMKEEVRIL